MMTYVSKSFVSILSNVTYLMCLTLSNVTYLLVAATCPSTVLFSFGVVDQCTEHDKTLQCITSETAEARVDGVRKALLADLMGLQLSGTNIPQISLHPLIYPNRTFYISKPLLDFFQDSALSSKITVHLNGQVTFMGTEIEMKDFLAIVAESYLSKRTHNGEKQSMLVPHFSRYVHMWNRLNSINHMKSICLGYFELLWHNRKE